MSPMEARAEALKLRSEGKTYNQVKDELNRRGYRHQKTGKPLSYGGVFTLVNPGSRKPGRPKKKKAAPKAAVHQVQPQVPSRKTAKLDAIRSILKLKIDDHEKVSLALAVLD